MYNEKDERRNASGCFDPTAYRAINNVYKQQEQERFHKFLGCLYRVGELSDFYIESIVVKDKRTGKVWKTGVDRNA